MASEITLLSKSGDWKADVEAWKNNFLFYKSIGTQVTVYHRQQTSNIWGNTVTDWMERAARSISITNVYRGTGPGVATRAQAFNNVSHAELKEWAVGVTLTLPVDSPTDIGGGAILTLDDVTGTVVVQLDGETLRGEVTASSALADSSIW